MKNVASSFLVTLILVGTLIVVFDIRLVKATQNIYIRVDGRIDPPTANITTTDNITYTFTDNNYALIMVERSNIVINGNGNTLQGLAEEEDSVGFYWNGISNVTITNTTIDGFWCGIHIANSSHNSLCGNYIPSCLHRPCIHLEWSSHNLISGNTLRGGGYGIGIRGRYSSDNNISGNDIEIGWRSVGFSLGGNNNLISGNRICGNSYGGLGIFGDNNTVTGNHIVGNYEAGGIGLMGDDNSLRGNTIIGHDHGIYISDSSNNTVSENNITNNTYGILLRSSSSNIIHHNNFISNFLQVDSINSTNIWDDGYPSGGNYWGDYAGADEYSGPYQNISGCDGIGDTPYTIDADNRDNYPLMHPWTPSGLTATLDIFPQVLNLRSKGKWITAYIELPEGYDALDISVSSIMLNNTILAEPKPLAIGDYDSDGNSDLMVKFDKATVISCIFANVDFTKPYRRRITITLTLTGSLNDGMPFKGSNTIKVIYASRDYVFQVHMLRYEKYMQRFCI